MESHWLWIINSSTDPQTHQKKKKIQWKKSISCRVAAVHVTWTPHPRIALFQHDAAWTLAVPSTVFALTESSALRPSKQHEAPATCIVDVNIKNYSFCTSITWYNSTRITLKLISSAVPRNAQLAGIQKGLDSEKANHLVSCMAGCQLVKRCNITQPPSLLWPGPWIVAGGPMPTNTLHSTQKHKKKMKPYI